MPSTTNTNSKAMNKFLLGVLEEGSSLASRSYFDDPTSVGFTLFFDFGGEESPLFNTTSHGESAIRYLYAIDEPERAEALKRFRRNFRRIVKEYPYYFKTLTGLGNPYAFNPDVAYESDRVLTINTMESMDMRIGNIIEDYVFATFDMEYRRQMLPENLMLFRVKIIVSEIRRFRTYIEDVMPNQGGEEKGGAGTLKGREKFKSKFNKGFGALKDKVKSGIKGVFGTGGGDAKGTLETSSEGSISNMKDIADNISTYVYDFTHCVFDFSESQPFLETLSNESPDFAENLIKIKVGQMRTAHKMGFLDLFVEPEVTGNPVSIKDTSDKTKVGKFLSNIGGKVVAALPAAKAIAGSFIAQEADQFLQANDPRNIAKRYIQDKFLDPFASKVNSLLFGNVFLGRIAGTFGDSSELIIKQILDPRGDLSQRGINVGALAANFKSELGIKDIGTPSTDPSNLTTKVLGTPSTDPSNLTTKVLGTPSTDPQTLASTTVGTPSTDPSSLSISPTNQITENEDDLGSKGLNILSDDDLDNLGVKDVGEQTEDDKGLGVKDVGDGVEQNSDDLGRKDVGDQSVNPSDLDTAPTSDGVEQNSDDLGTKKLGDQSVNPSDLDTAPTSDGIEQNSDDLGRMDVGELSRNMVQSLDSVNTGSETKFEIPDLSNVDVGDITFEQLKTLGIVELAGMSIDSMADLGLTKIGDLTAEDVAELGALNVGKSENLDLMRQNIDGFEEAPFTKLLEQFAKSNLGSVISGKPATDANTKSLGNVFGKTESDVDNINGLGSAPTGEMDGKTLDQKSIRPKDC